jgi:hypothetical protein
MRVGRRTDTCRTGVAWALAVVAALAFHAGTAAAQEGGGGSETAAVPRIAASPPLAPDHWAARAAARAEALGLAPGYLPPQRAATRTAVAAALHEAASAAGGDPALGPLADGWLRRFLEEFPEYRARPAGEVPRLLATGGYAAVGVEEVRGRLEPVAGAYHRRVDPRPIDDLSGPAARAAAGLSAAGRLSGHAELRVGDGGGDVPVWEVAAALGAVELALGRLPVGYGPARGGGIVVGANAPLVAVHLQTPQPVRFGGVLRHLGQVTAHTAATRLTEDRHPGDPFFWSAHLGFQPHPRLTVGINRAAIFGGDSIDIPVNLRNLVGMFVGELNAEFENQVVSLDFRYRAPTEAVLPLLLYLEWGAEDAAGGWWSVPGIVGGARVPAVPGVPELELGVEHTWFRMFCCGNPPWYIHAGQLGGWGAGGAPLGHPLGGEGRETLAYAAAELADARVRLEARGFLRHRGDEGFHQVEAAGNLFTPDRTGRSTGGALTARLRVLPMLEVAVDAFHDAGDGWRERHLRAGAALLF